MKKVKRKHRARSVLTLFLAVVLLVGCNSQTGGEEHSATEADRERNDNTEVSEPLELDVFAVTFSTNPPGSSSPVLQALEDYTNTKLTINWAPNSNIDDKFNITLASGDLPHVMYIPGKTPSFISAVRDGAFWELGPYLTDYDNLSQANEIVLNNTMIDGKIYGIYRARALGRNGIVYRQDWLENLNMDPPRTIDDFYEMLKAFTYDDPDGNGEDDTYGTVVSKFEGPWNVMQTWFGAPNKWGIDPEGHLIPDFLTDEYREALDFFKKLYDEGLVNEDFAVMDPAEWVDPMNNGRAGVIVDVLDSGERIRRAIEDLDKNNTDPIGLLGSVEGPRGTFNLPTSGYAGMFAIPKTKVSTEEELRQVLEFLDKMNDEEAQILAANGLEGTHYEWTEGEFVNLSLDNEALTADFDSLNQLLMFIPEDYGLTETPTELKELEAEIVTENEEIVVANPAESLISQVYSQKGQQLDTIIQDARIQFIVGQIDEEGFNEAIALWERSGGTELIEEMNQLYIEAHENMD